MEVVLPTPLTPMNSTTLGVVDRSSAVSPTSISSARMSRRAALTSSWPVSYTHLRELIKGRVLENNLDYDARTAAAELARATRSEVVQVIGTKFVLYRESHSKPREKRIQLVKPSKKRQA